MVGIKGAKDDEPGPLLIAYAAGFATASFLFFLLNDF